VPFTSVRLLCVSTLRDAPPARGRGRTSGWGPHAEERMQCASRTTGPPSPSRRALTT